MNSCPHCGRDLTTAGRVWPGFPANAFKIEYRKVENQDRIDYLDHRLAEAFRRIDDLEARVALLSAYVQVTEKLEQERKVKP